ncbi:hypothetical protein LJB78_01410, partial [Bacteroidales bacterium OttesenSCG-928-J16]|nr:hypothetical protein [Bacteroidales bacterium OttesenSCG-928-J16]
STGILVDHAQYYHQDPHDDGKSEWRNLTMISSYEYFQFSIPEAGYELAGGDSLLVKVTAYAPCGFFSGADIKFTVDAFDACGTFKLDRAEAVTDILYIDLDLQNMDVDYTLTSEIIATYKNTAPVAFGHGDSNPDRLYEIDNNFNKTVTWEGTFSIADSKLPNYDYDSIYFIIPDGMIFDPASFECTSHPAYYDNNTIKPYITIDYIAGYGTEYGIELPSEFQADDVITFQMDIDVSKASCDIYNFYIEIISTVDSVFCAFSQDSCTVYETQSGNYFDMKIQWYEMEFIQGSPESYGVMAGDDWSKQGRYLVHNTSAFYDDDELYRFLYRQE